MAFFTFINDSIEVLLKEGKNQPKMISIGLHPRIIGHPGRMKSLLRLLDIVSDNKEIWVTRRVDIANHWIKHFYP